MVYKPLSVSLLLGAASGYQLLSGSPTSAACALPRTAAPLASFSASGSLQAASQQLPQQRCEAVEALPFEQTQQQQQQQQRLRQRQQQQQQWPKPLVQGALAILSAATLAGAVNVRSASAENELATLAASKSTSELVKPGCFATSCKTEVESCGADGDCVKGLACSAKCMGDAQCTMGCFARYGNPTLDKVLQCTIEDAGCIQIATQEPGADSAFDAPRAPKKLVAATPAMMSGKWYKVLGFNPNYDCFDNQKNSFTAGADAAKRAAGSEVGLTVGPSSAVVDVEYTMPRDRAGAPPETFHATLTESLEFDTAPGAVRTAHTEGHMFGLTFWENWYLIGSNQPKEPEFRFVYYTGKTLQNRYEGAFVYARKPELPQTAMPAIYKLAREAGFEPTNACAIDNSGFSAPDSSPTAQPPLFTPVASADTLDAAAAVTSPPPSSIKLPGVLENLRRSAIDVEELLEDPKPYGDAIFKRQRKMSEVREYDANGFRVPSASFDQVR